MSPRASYAFAVMLAACSSSPTQVIVQIDADEEVRNAADSIEIRVFALEDADDVEGTRVFLGGRAAEGFPLQHVIAPAEGDAARRYRVRVAALGAGGGTLASIEAISGYVEGETRVLPLFLAGACLDRPCPIGSTCANGGCIDVPVIPSVNLPRRGQDASLPIDAGADTSDDVEAGPICVAGDSCELPPDLMGECVSGGVIECLDGVASCVPELSPAGTSCRPANGLCDVEDACDGVSPSCADAKATDNEPCGATEDGTFCFDGECRACVDGEECAFEECVLGVRRCGGGPPRCERDRPAGTDVPCRDSQGPCDAEETCDGAGSCPADDFVPASANQICREAMGDCDVAETCDGLGAQCPSDRVADSSVVCRPGDGQCLLDTTCPGGSAVDCPMGDLFANDRTVCGSETGECDPSDFCSGTSDECVAVVTAVDTPCDTDTGEDRICNGSGDCIIRPRVGESCDVPGAPCEVGVIENVSGAEVCVSQGPVPNDTPCELAGMLRECESTPTCQSGVCERTFRPGEPCGAEPSNPCRQRATCLLGQASCPGFRSAPDGTTCGTNPDECIARACMRGNCVDVNVPDGVACGATGECAPPSACRDGECRAMGSTNGLSCGDTEPTSECDNADTCLDGECRQNQLPDGSSCGDIPTTECSST
ncbi:MAG: hypothetical protein AAF411_29590, partial [Myxococcota bacterium]